MNFPISIAVNPSLFAIPVNICHVIIIKFLNIIIGTFKHSFILFIINKQILTVTNRAVSITLHKITIFFIIETLIISHLECHLVKMYILCCQ